MAVYTEEITTEYAFSNIAIYKQFKDEVQYGWKITPESGYVMYDTTDRTFETQTDPETGEEIEVPVTYYYTVAYLPLNYNFDAFPWVAVLRSSVDENYIFGLPENEHETI